MMPSIDIVKFIITLLLLQRARQKMSDGVFSVAGPCAQNQLPTELKPACPTTSFKRLSEGFLFIYFIFYFCHYEH